MARNSGEPPPGQTPVCGIGASAGGVAALSAFFKAAGPDPGIAYVVVVHLDPTHKSQLSEILANQTSMPVEEVAGRVTLRPNHIYVIPPDRELVIHGDELTARPFTEPRGRRAPIDLFFRSLAAGRGDGMAVVLSGAGSDGAVGVRAVKEAGGVIFVQDPREAEYPIMPQSAIATGVADFITPIAAMAERIAEVVRSKHAVAALSGEDADAQIREIVGFLRARTGHDFSNYKRATVTRRVARRMQVRRMASLGDYNAYLRDNAEEAQELFGDLLISVTMFFRDPEAFEVLSRDVIAPLFEDRGADAELRIWAAGCATGEEAYSLAILFLEQAARLKVSPRVQIFATDLDDGALATAREGRYPTSIEADVSEERLTRFFTNEGTHYRVRKEVRDLVLFALHSALKDPPFLKLDLISCRNLMIYLDRELQRQISATFHYALAGDGALFLGSAENVDVTPDLFRPLDREARIYRANPDASRRLPILPQMPIGAHASTLGDRFARAQESERGVAAAHAAALEQLAPPSVLVDEEHGVVHFSETAGRFVLPSKGALPSDLPTLVRPELRLDLKSALHRAFENHEATLTPPIPVAFNGAARRVSMQIAPAPGDGRAAMRALVFFLDGGETAADEAPVEDAGAANSDQMRRLNEELRHARDRLSGSRRDHESTIQELRAANEELQSINEEYRSTSEELETSKEELQSINEELQTVNAELKSKLESISTAHSDLQNLIAATEIGTLFLDPAMRIKLFTPAVAELFNIKDADTGRAISDFTHNLAYDGVEEDAKRVLRDLAPHEGEIATKDGRWLMMRLRPYRTIDDRIDGVVISFVDVTARREAEARLRETSDLLAMATTSSNLGWATWDFGSQTIQWDERGRDIVGLAAGKDAAEDWLGRIHPDDRPRVEEVMRERMVAGAPFELDYRILMPDGAVRHILGTGAFQRDGNGTAVRATGLVRDMTELKNWEESQKLLIGELNHRVKNMLAVVVSIARQSQRSAETKEAFVEAFEQRVHALAAAHGLLTRRNWGSVGLRALADAALASFIEDGGDRIRIRGPAVELAPNAAISMAMAFHELATNAVKHGALSSRDGRVELAWRVPRSAGAPRKLALTWTERDGPRVASPAREGFGSRLLEQGVARELEGAVRIDYREDGVVCKMEFPIDGAVRKT